MRNVNYPTRRTPHFYYSLLLFKNLTIKSQSHLSRFVITFKSVQICQIFWCIQGGIFSHWEFLMSNASTTINISTEGN